MKTVLVTAVACALLAAAGPRATAQGGTMRPAGLHLSSFASRLSARLSGDGALDTGAGVLELVDAETGAPLPAERLAFGQGPGGPQLTGAWKVEVAGTRAGVKALALPVTHGGDTRLRALLRFELENHGNDTLEVQVAARLSPGGADPLRQPIEALPFEPGVQFGREGDVITRDGAALLTWMGPDPEVTLHPSAETPDATVALLRWRLAVPANTALFLDLALAGPPTTEAVDEAGWRASFSEWSFATAEEQLGWQSG
jgi:hypothetical protein